VALSIAPSTASAANAAADYMALFSFLCLTNGVCCTSSSGACNSASLIIFNQSNLLFLTFSSLIAKLFF